MLRICYKMKFANKHKQNDNYNACKWMIYKLFKIYLDFKVKIKNAFELLNVISKLIQLSVEFHENCLWTKKITIKSTLNFNAFVQYVKINKLIILQTYHNNSHERFHNPFVLYAYVYICLYCCSHSASIILINLFIKLFCNIFFCISYSNLYFCRYLFVCFVICVVGTTTKKNGCRS